MEDQTLSEAVKQGLEPQRGRKRRTVLKQIGAASTTLLAAGCTGNAPHETTTPTETATEKTTTEAVGNQTTARNQEPKLDIPEWIEEDEEIYNPEEKDQEVLTRTGANLKDNANRHEQLDDLAHFSYRIAGRSNRREAVALWNVAADNLHTEDYDNFNVGQDTHIQPEWGLQTGSSSNGLMENGTVVFIDQNGNQRCQFTEPAKGGGLKDAKGSEAYTVGENFGHVSFASGHATAGYMKGAGYLEEGAFEDVETTIWEDLHTKAALSLNGIIPRQNRVATDFQTQLEAGRRRTNPDEGNVVEFIGDHLDAVRQAQRQSHEDGVVEQVTYENGEFTHQPRNRQDMIREYEEDLRSYAESI